jgi:hypothetical protein
MASRESRNRLLKSLGATAVACFARSMDGRLTTPLQNSFRSVATRLRGILKKLNQRDLGAVPTSDVNLVGEEADAATRAIDSVATERRGEEALDLSRSVASRADKLGA